MSAIKTILLVCTGNSCRSVMAAGLLKKMLKGKGDYKIMTAGTMAIRGIRPSPGAVEVMAEEGIDISGHSGQPLNDEMLRQADLILVMEERQKENILMHHVNIEHKVYLLSEFGRIANENKLVDPNIPDPIGKSLDFYRKVYSIIKEGIIRTVKKLEEEGK